MSTSKESVTYSNKKCVKCGQPASFTVKNPATTLYYCSEHYAPINTKITPTKDLDTILEKLIAEVFATTGILYRQKYHAENLDIVYAKAKSSLQAWATQQVVEELSHIQLDYGDRFSAVTYASGTPQTLMVRIEDLKQRQQENTNA